MKPRPKPKPYILSDKQVKDIIKMWDTNSYETIRKKYHCSSQDIKNIVHKYHKDSKKNSNRKKIKN